jgi:anti-sigma B factor antagonist
MGCFAHVTTRPAAGRRVREPQAAPPRIDYAYPNDGVTIVSLSGDCDLASGAVLRRALSYVVEDDPELFVIDLTEASFFDSTALRTLLEANRRRRHRGRGSIVLVVNRLVRRVLELSATDTVFELQSTRDAALTERIRSTAPRVSAGG